MNLISDNEPDRLYSHQHHGRVVTALFPTCRLDLFDMPAPSSALFDPSAVHKRQLRYRLSKVQLGIIETYVSYTVRLVRVSAAE